MPRVKQVALADATPSARTHYQRLFGDRDPVAEPGTATGTVGNWWTVYANVPDQLDAMVDLMRTFRAPERVVSARQRELTLAEGATLTGGRREYLLTSMALADRLRSLANELQHQYRIDYARPSTLIPPERIEVDVKRTGLTVRAPRILSAAATKS